MTYHVARVGRETAPNLFFAAAGIAPVGEANTATVDRLGSASGFGAVGNGALRGPMVRNLMVAGDVDQATRKIIFPPGALSASDSFPDNRFRNAKLRAYRKSGNRLVEAGETTVTASVAKFITNQHAWEKMISAGTGRYIWSMDGFNQKGMVRYFAVAAVFADGKRSPWSAPVAFTFGRASAASQQDPNLVNGPKVFGAYTVDPALAAPTGVTASGLNGDMTVQIDFTPTPGSVGTIVGYSNHAEFVSDEHMVLADASFVQKGDLLVLSKRFDHTVPKLETLSQRVWDAGSVTWRYGTGGLGMHFNEDVAGSGRSFEYRQENGTPYIRVTVPAGFTQKFEQYTHSGTAQTWYDILTPGTMRRIRVRVRAVGSPITTARFVMDAMGPAQPVPSIDTTWQEPFADFTAPAPVLSDKIPRSTRLEVPGPAVIDMEWLVVHDPAVPPEDMVPQLKQMLLHSGCEYIRQHPLIKTNAFSYAAEEILEPLGPATTRGESVTQFLGYMRDLRAENGGRGLNPWCQVEGHLSDDENRLIAGALCTVYDPAAPDSPYKRGAKMRVDAGQIAPWQDVFGRVMMEVGNENWNPLGGFYRLPDTATATGAEINGLMLDRMADAILAAPGCKPDKFRFYLGGWAINDGWNRNSALSSRHADYIGYADYNGGWDSGLTAALSADDPKAVFSTLAESNLVVLGETRATRMSKLVALCATVSQGRAKPIRAMQYEAGPGYVLNGLNGSSVTPEQAASQEMLMKSVASGTATLNAFMLNKALGVVSSNFFTIQAGDYWTSGSRPERGGAMNPPFLWTSFANVHLTGGVKKLEGDTATALTTPDGKAAGMAVQVYQVARPDGRMAYVIANLDPATAHPVKLRLKSARRWTRHTMTGDLKTSNTQLSTKDAVSIVAEQMPAGWGQSVVTITLPPGKAEVYIEDAA